MAIIFFWDCWWVQQQSVDILPSLAVRSPVFISRSYSIIMHWPYIVRWSYIATVFTWILHQTQGSRVESKRSLTNSRPVDEVHTGSEWGKAAGTVERVRCSMLFVFILRIPHTVHLVPLHSMPRIVLHLLPSCQTRPPATVRFSATFRFWSS